MGKASLTVAWWNGVKKEKGKSAPTLGLTPVLESYEKAYAKLLKEKNNDNLNKTKLALGEVKTVQKSAELTLKNNKKCEELYSEISSSLVGAITRAKEELEKFEKEIGLDLKIEKAGNVQEAAYEVAWDGFEKIRDKLKVTQDRGDYQLALDLLGDLKLKAGKVIDSPDNSLVMKYQKQLKVLAGLEATILSDSKAYDSAIEAMGTEREALLKEFEAADTLLTQAMNLCSSLKEKAKTANGEALVILKKQVAMIATGALKRYAEVSKDYAPDTKIRGALDVKAARMSQADSLELITPYSNKGFTLFKELSTTKKAIEEIVNEVALIQ